MAANDDEMLNLVRQVSALQMQVTLMGQNVDKLNHRLEELNSAANRWKGGVWIVLALGSIFGWALSIAARLLPFNFPGH